MASVYLIFLPDIYDYVFLKFPTKKPIKMLGHVLFRYVHDEEQLFLALLIPLFLMYIHQTYVSLSLYQN